MHLLISFCLWQWTSGLWVASWQNSSLDRCSSQALTVSSSLHHHDVTTWSHDLYWPQSDYIITAGPSLDSCLPDIDQLTRILQIVGTPDKEFLDKVTSDTVSIVLKHTHTQHTNTQTNTHTHTTHKQTHNTQTNTQTNTHTHTHSFLLEPLIMDPPNRIISFSILCLSNLQPSKSGSE